MKSLFSSLVKVCGWNKHLTFQFHTLYIATEETRPHPKRHHDGISHYYARMIKKFLLKNVYKLCFIFDCYFFF